MDLVCCQEEIQRILNYHEGLLQKAPAHAAAGKTASPPAGLVSGTNRLNRLLATATAEQIQQVILHNRLATVPRTWASYSCTLLLTKGTEHALPVDSFDVLTLGATQVSVIGWPYAFLLKSFR